jgi:hypothetical protein
MHCTVLAVVALTGMMMFETHALAGNSMNQAAINRR